MSDTAPVKDPHAATLIVAYIDHTGHLVLKDDGRFLLRMTRKHALHLITRIAATLAEGVRDE
jgi:hypothetical protein